MSRTIPAGLAAIALGLGLVVAFQLLAPVAQIEDAGRPAPPRLVNGPVTAESYRPPPMDRLDIISSRSMFDPRRQMAVEPALAEGTASAQPPDLFLVGVVIGSADSVALLRRSADRTAISAHVGWSIDGWHLVRIGTDSVVFRSEGREFTLKLRAAAGLPQPALNNASAPSVTGPSGR